MKKFIILLFLFSSFIGQAQKTEIGVIAGVSLYSGDISPKEFGLFFQELQPAFGIFGRLNASKAFSARISLSYTKLSADVRKMEPNCAFGDSNLSCNHLGSQTFRSRP